MKEIEAKAKPYMYIFYNFLSQYRIADEDLRNEFLYKFYKCFDNYKKMDGITIELYLKKTLKLIRKHYWSDEFRKKRINMKYYSELSSAEKDEWKIGLAIDDKFNLEIDSPEVLYVKSFIRCLTFKQKTIVYYLFYDCLTFKEISVKIGTTKQNVNKIWNKIKDKFANYVVVDFADKDSNKLLRVNNGK